MRKTITKKRFSTGIFYFLTVVLALTIYGCGSIFSRGDKKEPVEEAQSGFFLDQKDYAEHGRKGKLDRLYQLDPGGNSFRYDKKFLSAPPRVIVVLPFENLIGGNLILNGFEIKREDTKEKDEWSWTYANRLRTYFYGHLVPREFDDVELIAVDAILHGLKIDTPEKLYSYSPEQLGKILDADALIYGKVTRYDSKYYALFSQIAIGMVVRCISTKDGTVLFEAQETRTANEIRVATNPLDFVIASFQNSMSLRDVYRSRASEEVCREIVLRIPIVKSLKDEKEAAIIEKINKGLPESSIVGKFDPFAASGNLTENDDVEKNEDTK